MTSMVGETPSTAAVAREVVEAYGLDFGAHPVGTGPHMLGEYKASARIVLDPARCPT
jgi:ABC-type transport system substrate-binding protein